MLKAIAGLTGDPRSAEPKAVAGTAPATAVLPVSEAERRHVSVMFADLVGSTAVAERLDPEEMRQILHEFHRAATGAIEAPTLLLFGKYDPVVPARRDGVVAARSLPGARLVVMSSGHAPFAEVPEAFLAQVLPFLARCISPLPKL